MVTLADELIAMARHFHRGIPVNQQTLALDALQRVKDAGSRGIFLTDDHTFDHFENALFLPTLLDRNRYDTWFSEGAKDLYQRSNARARELLAEHRPRPEMDSGLALKIDEVLNRL
jgi:trimethylamine--corrinoid protein Co-methyltransferase